MVTFTRPRSRAIAVIIAGLLAAQVATSGPADDALGRLTGVSGTGVTAGYELDGAGNRWAETVNGVTTEFDLDLSAANPTILADGTRTYPPGDPGAGYAQAGTWHSALVDQLGSALMHVSQSGSTTTAAHYDPYGAPRAGSADPMGIAYAGEWMNETGLINLRARQYDPVTARSSAATRSAGSPLRGLLT